MSLFSRPLIVLGLLLAAGCQKEAPPPPPAPAPVAAPSSAPEAPPPPVPPKPVTPDDIPVPALQISAAPGDVAKGKQLFVDKGCSVCHAAVPGVKPVGPDLKGVIAKRGLPYVERMVLRPDVMIRTDATAKQLFSQYSVPMTNQRVDPAAELPLLMDYLASLGK